MRDHIVECDAGKFQTYVVRINNRSIAHICKELCYAFRAARDLIISERETVQIKVGVMYSRGVIGI